MTLLMALYGFGEYHDRFVLLFNEGGIGIFGFAVLAIF